MQRLKARTSRNRGFTLIELLLVMVILAILAAVVVPRMVGKSEMAKLAAAKTDINMLEGALNTFEVETGRFPTSEEGLAALSTRPGNVQTWNGPYVQHPPKDPWGNAYVYVYPGQHNPTGYDLYTTHNGTDTSGNEINNWGGSGN
jgi:general secretion pathway protein G